MGHGTHEVVERHDLVLHAEADVVRVEEVGVLFLELLPHEAGEPGLNVRLDLQGGDDLGLRHVLLQAALDQVLDDLDLVPGDLQAGKVGW